MSYDFETGRTYTYAEVTAAMTRAHSKGKAAGEATVLHGLHTVAALNGSGLRVFNAIREKAEQSDKSRWISAKIKKLIAEGHEHEQAVAEALHLWDEGYESKAWDDEDDPVEKAATYVETEHPRDRTGKWLPKGDIDAAAHAAAKGDHSKAEFLRSIVSEGDRHILEQHLAHPVKPDPTARTGVVRDQRAIGEDRGEDVRSWLGAVTAAIRHGADYDHGEITSAIQRATAGAVPKLRRVLRALDPETKISDQPAHKEGLQRRIREIISTAVHAAKDDRLHRETAERSAKQQAENELHGHTTMALHDARERLHRMRGWHSAAPDEHSTEAVRMAEEHVARLTGLQKAWKEEPVEPPAVPPAL